MSFGPVIKGYNIHVTVFERNGIFHSHLTYSGKNWKKSRHETIVTMSSDKMIEVLRKASMESISVLFEKYDESDEALVMTDEGRRIFRELLKGSITVNVKGQKLLFDFKFGYLINKEKILKKKVNQLFKIGTASEALKNDLFGGRLVFSPELKPIMVLDNEMYILRRNPLEIINSLKPKVRSGEEFFEELKKTELRSVAKYAEIFGIEKLFVEMEHQNLFKKWLPQNLLQN
jgi:hypothetical protein